uniref:RNA helicase n=1 Tax=Rhabditophanes sp. KR3021 TaxID=114890 RepID=A0AC35TNT4_9BILA
MSISCFARFRQFWRDFASWSSIAGLNHIFSSTNIIFSLFWLIVTLCCALVGMIQSYDLIEVYWRYPVNTEAVSKNSDITFPAVTFCNDSPYKYDGKNSILNAIVRHTANKTPAWGFSQVTDTDNVVYTEVGKFWLRMYSEHLQQHPNINWNFDDLVIRCSYGSISCNSTSFAIRRNPLYGTCFTINSNGDWSVGRVGSEFGLNLLIRIDTDKLLPFYISTGAVMFIHEQAEYPFIDENAVLLSTETTTSIGLSIASSSKLPKPYGNCISTRTKKLEGVNTYYEGGYELEKCVRSCVQDKIVAACKCYYAGYGHEGLDATIPNCIGYIQSNEGARSAVRKETYDCIRSQLYSGGSVYDPMKSEVPMPECKCSEPCEKIYYDLSYSVGTYPSKLHNPQECRKAYLNNNAMIKTHRYNDNQVECHKYYSTNVINVDVYFEKLNYVAQLEYAAYPLFQMIYDVIGILSLWLGVSVISLFEMFLLVIMLFLFMVYAPCLQKIVPITKREVRANVWDEMKEDIEGTRANNLDKKDVYDKGVKIKKRKVVKNAAFNTNFEFDVLDTRNQKNDLDGIKQFLKNSRLCTLQQKINKERHRNKKSEVQLQKDLVAAKETGEDEDDLVQELDEVLDSVKLKDSSIKKRKVEEAFFDNSSELNGGQKVVESFHEMDLSKPLQKAVTDLGFITPTQIQASCIPLGLSGRDICACSATGTGKTAAFMLPILERLLFKPKTKQSIRVLVLCPTRELAIQVYQVTRKLAEFSKIELCLCAGGLDVTAQEHALSEKPDILIATPGRLIDLVKKVDGFTLKQIEVLILDEADRMLEDAFADQMKELIQMCGKKRQTMLFSATMTDEIEDLVKMSLKKPIKLFINENTKTATNLSQEFVRIREGCEENREAIIAALVTRNFIEHTIIFVSTKKQCERLHIVLGLLGVNAGQLHGGMNQTQRVTALNEFKCGKIDVLVSTDLASRGLDIENVQTVINFTMPRDAKVYVHRVGRTARAGKSGRAISLIGEDERKIVKQIVKANKVGSQKQRTVASSVVTAYKKRIDSLETSIKRIEDMERAEREIRDAEAETKKIEDAREE